LRTHGRIDDRRIACVSLRDTQASTGQDVERGGLFQCDAALVHKFINRIADVSEIGESRVQLIDEQDGARREVAERGRGSDGLNGTDLLRDACLSDDEIVLG
jgi:hypothetical protein